MTSCLVQQNLGIFSGNDYMMVQYRHARSTLTVKYRHARSTMMVLYRHARSTMTVLQKNELATFTLTHILQTSFYGKQIIYFCFTALKKALTVRSVLFVEGQPLCKFKIWGKWYSVQWLLPESKVQTPSHTSSPSQHHFEDYVLLFLR